MTLVNLFTAVAVVVLIKDYYLLQLGADAASLGRIGRALRWPSVDATSVLLGLFCLYVLILICISAFVFPNIVFSCVFSVPLYCGFQCSFLVRVLCRVLTCLPMAVSFLV